MTLRVHDAVAHVAASLEISPVDAATYVRLCMGGPWKVSELAAALEVHRNDVYRSLERLGARGLVESTLENPARYIASDPLRTFDVELDRRAAAAKGLREARERMEGLVEELRGAHRGPPKAAGYGILQGRQEIATTQRRLIGEAREEILLLATAPHALGLAELDGTLDAILARGREGVRARIVVAATEDELRRAGLDAAPPGVEARRWSSAAPVHLLVADREKILLDVLTDPGRSVYAAGDVALLTGAAGLLEAERVFFEQAWADAAPVRPDGAGSAL